MANTKINIGLLGASRIAGPAIIKPVAELDGVEITSVAARDPQRAATFAAAHGIRNVATDYAALVAFDEVDLVYNALPPSLHLEWSIAAMVAGKDVLCEKPFALNAGQADVMVEKAAECGRTLIEAFHYRFHPLFERVLEIVNSGRIGSVQNMRSHCNIRIPYRPGELRHELALGGGALMDLGCYPVHWVRTVMHTEPAVVSASAIQERAGVDVAMQAVLEFSGGTQAEVGCSMASDLPPGVDATLVVAGSRGKLTVINPLSPHSGHELTLETPDGRHSEKVPGASTYHHQLAHVIKVLAGEVRPITGGRDAIANMAVIDSIYEAAGMQPRGAAAG